MNEVKLEQIWHLRNVGQAEDRWEFSTNYKVPIENNVLRQLLQGETAPPIRMVDRPDLLKLVRVLMKEIRTKTEGPTEIGEGPYRVTATRQLDRLMRKPTQEGRERALICVVDVLGPQSRKLQEFVLAPQIDELSAVSTDAVYALDRLAAETCFRIFGEKARALDAYPPEAIPTARNVSVFIAYRRTHIGAAQRLYDVLFNAGMGTLFTPYLDHHDMRLGDWEKQLFDRIERSDIFMPLVSPDYAEPGTVGHEEYEWAKEVATRRGLGDFFAPVFLGTARSAVGIELREFDGFIARSEDDLSTSNRALDKWLGRVVVAGLSRPSAPLV